MKISLPPKRWFDISNDMLLDQARPQKTYKINRILALEDSPVAIRMRQLGLIEDQVIFCESIVPIFQGPYLFHVRGSQVALAKSEARLIEVQEV